MVYSLSLNTSDYTVKSLTMDNDTISYRAYENIVYVKNPVDTKYQMMNIYVPVVRSLPCLMQRIIIRS